VKVGVDRRSLHLKNGGQRSIFEQYPQASDSGVEILPKMSRTPPNLVGGRT